MGDELAHATTAPAHPGMIRIVPWWDPDLAIEGFGACSDYTERFWLPVLGPSALLALRWSAQAIARHPSGLAISVSQLSESLGLGVRAGTNGPASRALRRLAYFGLAREWAGTTMVRTHVPVLPPRHLRRLPGPLRDDHTGWLLRKGTPGSEPDRRPQATLRG